MRNIALPALAAAVLLTTPALALAQEAIAYGYDSRGRLVRVERSGTVNNGVVTDYSHDQADNRIAVTTGSGGGPIFSIGDAAPATEGDLLFFTVTRSGVTNVAASVWYVTVDGTAVAGSDFHAAASQLSFAANETSKTLSVLSIGDALAEGAETFTMNLHTPSGGATIADADGTGTINDP